MASNRDSASLSFEERIKLKQQAGFDDLKFNREKIALRKEAANKHKNTEGKVKNKKLPKEKYSKLPVSIVRTTQKDQSDGPKSGYKNGVWVGEDIARDPRFHNSSGKLNEGMFKRSYSFIKDVQNERFSTLKEKLREAKKDGNHEFVAQIKKMLGDEKDWAHKQRQHEKDKDIIRSLKEANKDRAAQGKTEFFAKKRDLKEIALKQQFDELDKKGKLDKFMAKQHEEMDRKRARKW